LSGSSPHRKSRGLIGWGAAAGVSSTAGIIAGLTIRPLRELGALCIFGAVGSAMMVWRGLYGPPADTESDSSDGVDGSDGDGGGDSGD
jgi:hypothetical protein